MALFLVHMHHPNEAGWRRHIMAHVEFLRRAVADGEVIASGGLVGTPVKGGFLIVSAQDRAAAERFIARDPFWTEKLIEDLSIVEWDPIFGAFNDRSSMPGFDRLPPPAEDRS